MQSKFLKPFCSYYGKCPMDKTCRRIATEIQIPDCTDYTPGYGSVDVLIVGDHASLDEYGNGNFLPYRGSAGNLIRETIQKSGFSENLIALTYLVRGAPVDSKTIPPKYDNTFLTSVKEYDLKRIVEISLSNMSDKDLIIHNCLQFLMDDIQKLKPKLILAMGNTVVQTLLPRENRKVSALSDTTLDFMGIPLRVIPSPFIVIKNPSSRPSWESAFISAITGNKVAKITTVGPHIVLDKLQDVIDFINVLRDSPNEVAVDTETRNLNKRYGNSLAMIQFSDNINSSVVLPMYHPETPFTPGELEIIKQHLYKLFHEPSKIPRWVCHNAKFECLILKNQIGTSIVSAPIFDCMAAAYLLDENRVDRAADFKYGIYTLKQLSFELLNFDGYDKGILALREEGSLWDLPLKDLAAYGAIDSQKTLELKRAQLKLAADQNYTEQLLNLLYYLYTPMILLFTEIEYNGSYVNHRYVRKLYSAKSPILKEIEKLEQDFKEIPEIQKANDVLVKRSAPKGYSVYPLGQKPFIFDFAKQGHPQILFMEICGLKPGKIGKNGLASIDKAWQAENEHHPLVKKYKEWSELWMMYDTFVKKIYGYIDPVSGVLDCKTDSKIRPDFTMTKVVTGRIACKKPNLQQVPRSDNYVKKLIKNMFQILPGHVLIQFDFKANEMRWGGILAQDANMANSFNIGKKYVDKFKLSQDEADLKLAELYGDIHKQNAAKAFRVQLEQVDKSQRQKAKSLSFAILYDSAAETVAKMFNMDPVETRGMIDTFYEEHPGIKIWKESMRQQAKRQSFVETPHGRRRRFPIFDLFRKNGTINENEIPWSHKAEIAEALRQSINSGIQGTASDAAMLGSFFLVQYIWKHNKPWIIQNAVHDSVLFQVPFADLDLALEVSEKCLTTDVMEYMTAVWGINFNLPLEVEAEIGVKWGELHKWNFLKKDLEELKKVLKKETEELEINEFAA